MPIRESSAKTCVWLREASKMLSIRMIGNGWTANSRSENMKCRSVNLVLKELCL
jgi:broad-specificity NMP kinase